MASQRVLLFSIAGAFGNHVWERLLRWGAARKPENPGEWSYEQWPAQIREEAIAVIEKLIAVGFSPPILHRSEHVDLWSMNGDFDDAMQRLKSPYVQLILSHHYELFAVKVGGSEKLAPRKTATPEMRLLCRRINEAVTDWNHLAAPRVIVLIRVLLGGLWTDEEVTNTLGQMPSWWNNS